MPCCLHGPAGSAGQSSTPDLLPQHQSHVVRLQALLHELTQQLGLFNTCRSKAEAAKSTRIVDWPFLLPLRPSQDTQKSAGTLCTPSRAQIIQLSSAICGKRFNCQQSPATGDAALVKVRAGFSSCASNASPQGGFGPALAVAKNPHACGRMAAFLQET